MIELSRFLRLSLASPQHGDVVRTPRVTEHANFATLAFPAAPRVPLPQLGVAFETTVRTLPRLAGVREIAEYVRGRQARLSLPDDEALLRSGGIRVEESPAATVVTFDSHAAVRVRPGWTDVYLLPTDPALPTIVPEGTRFLQFEWSSLRLGTRGPRSAP